MDNLFEILIPIIFAAIYFFGNMFAGKSDDEGAPAPRRREEDPDAAERQRRIQEEIRRKINERRSQNQEGGRSRPQQPALPRRSLEERRREPDTSDSRNEQPTTSNQQPVTTFSWDTSDDIYTDQMQDRLKQIEVTKRQAAKLQKQAAAKTGGIGEPSPRRTESSAGRGRTRLSGPVRATLRDPAAARAAFIYGEVLGPPISQRKNASVPGLS